LQSRNERSRTKLIATLGPSTSDRDMLRRMFLDGIDVCRLNFSHGSREEHARAISMVREINSELGSSVAVLADLQGPKIRVGEVQGGSVTLNEGAELYLLTGDLEGNSEEVSVSYDALPVDVKPGDRILMDDGLIELSVMDSNGRDRVRTKIIHGGKLGSRKGVNLPSSSLSVPSLTEKDREDAVFAIEQGVDWIALSFVRSAGDIEDLRELVESSGGSAGLIAKIEKPQALEDIDRIIDTADAVMVARGDLGVEVEFHRVPMIQKMIVRKCLRAATPVIIATQMMESMIESYRPTRAEAADVANAVLDGADTLMLSGETAIGRYPDLVIRNMQRIIDWTEEHEGLHPLGPSPHTGDSGSFPDSICYSAVQMARQAGARAIVTFTHSGYTAVRISSHRPEADIFAFTMNRQLLPMLSLVWGVQAFYLESSGQIEDYTDRSMGFLRERELASPGDTVVHVGSIPLQEHGKTNMLKLSRIQPGP
jgi:pyruvate kinase